MMLIFAHVGEASQVVIVAVARHAVVFIGQNQGFLTDFQVFDCLLIFHEHRMDAVVDALCHHGFLFLASSRLQVGLSDVVGAFVKCREVVLQTQTDKPIVEVVVEHRHFDEDWAVQVVFCDEGKFGPSCRLRE